MWIKIKYKDINEKTIILPIELKKKFKKSVQLTFAKKMTKVNVEYSKNLQYNKSSSFENPLIIYMSKDLKSSLLIPNSQIYQSKFYKNNFSLGPVIGFMISEKQVGRSRHMKKYLDRFGIYNKIGGLIFAFSPEGIVWDENIVFGKYYNIKKKKWKRGVFPIPEVIYSRNFHQSQDFINNLTKITNGKLFNSYRFSKYELFKMVSQDLMLAKNLPATEEIKSFKQFKDFADIHQKIILKPNNLSRGRGICILEKKYGHYFINDYRKKKSFGIILNGEDELFNFYKKNTEFHENYLIQKYLNLAKVNDSVFDIRVVVQKEKKDEWKITGIECRVAKIKTLITNISRGGYALELDKALESAFQNKEIVASLTEKIHDYCLNLCSFLDNRGEHYAEFGLDIGVDIDQNIWVIEANVFPSFKGFKQIDYDTYLNIRYTPLLYCLSLTEFASGKEEL